MWDIIWGSRELMLPDRILIERGDLPMKRMYFIYNPVAGKAAVSEKLGDIIDRFVKADYEVTVRPTQSSDDAVLSANYACSQGYDLLVCSGGDGTLSQCLQGVMKSSSRIPIGYIPAGSTNDFAKSLGIPKGMTEAADWIIGGRPVPCDIGGFNDVYFTYIVAFGAFTNITYETSQPIKNLFGHSAYILSGLLQLTSIKAQRIRVEYEGNVIEDDFIFGMVTNSSSVAGFLSMSNFLLDDGVFEVTLIKKPANIMHLHQIVTSLLNMQGDIDREYIKCFRTNIVTFASVGGEPITWTRDGEYGGDSAVNTVFNYNRAVSFMVGDCKDTKFSGEA